MPFYVHVEPRMGRRSLLQFVIDEPDIVIHPVIKWRHDLFASLIKSSYDVQLTKRLLMSTNSGLCMLFIGNDVWNGVNITILSHT